MKSERKIAIQEKRIKRLEEQLRQETNLAKTLEKENADLKNKIETINSNNAFLQNQAKTTIENFNKETENLKSIKAEYVQLINDVKSKRKHYENKMASLLKRFKKQI